MNTQQRAAALGLLVGLAHTAMRLFVLESLTGGFTTATTQLVLQSLVSTLLSLAVIPGLPLYGAWRMGARDSPTRLAAFVGLGLVPPSSSVTRCSRLSPSARRSRRHSAFDSSGRTS